MVLSLLAGWNLWLCIMVSSCVLRCLNMCSSLLVPPNFHFTLSTKSSSPTFSMHAFLNIYRSSFSLPTASQMDTLYLDQINFKCHISFIYNFFYYVIFHLFYFLSILNFIQFIKLFLCVSLFFMANVLILIWFLLGICLLELVIFRVFPQQQKSWNKN